MDTYQSERHNVARANYTSDAYGGLQLFGTADWYVVRNKRGQVTIRREKNVKLTDEKLGGPYETYDQATCEKHGF